MLDFDRLLTRNHACMLRACMHVRVHACRCVSVPICMYACIYGGLLGKANRRSNSKSQSL